MPVPDKRRRVFHRVHRVWREATLWLDTNLAKLPYRWRSLRRTLRQKFAHCLPAGGGTRWARYAPDPLILLGIAAVALIFVVALQRQPPSLASPHTQLTPTAGDSGTISIELASFAEEPRDEPAITEAVQATPPPTAPAAAIIEPTIPTVIVPDSQQSGDADSKTPGIPVANAKPRAKRVFPGAGGESISLVDLSRQAPAAAGPLAVSPHIGRQENTRQRVPTSVVVDTIEAFPIPVVSEVSGIEVSVNTHSIGSELVRIPDQLGSHVAVPSLVVTDSSQSEKSQAVIVAAPAPTTAPLAGPVVIVQPLQTNPVPTPSHRFDADFEITDFLRQIDQVILTGGPNARANALRDAGEFIATIDDARRKTIAGCEIATRLRQLGDDGQAVRYLDAALEAIQSLEGADHEHALQYLGVCEARSGWGVRANLRLSQMTDSYLKTVTALHISRILEVQNHLSASQHAHEQAYHASKAITEIGGALKRALRRHPEAG